MTENSFFRCNVYPYSKPDNVKPPYNGFHINGEYSNGYLAGKQPTCWGLHDIPIDNDYKEVSYCHYRKNLSQGEYCHSSIAEFIDSSLQTEIKHTIVTDVNSYSSHQKYDKITGDYSIVRKNGNKVISGYEMNLNDALPNRKFANGFRGKLQKLALKIGVDANGCERPVLSKVSGFLFNTVKKVK